MNRLTNPYRLHRPLFHPSNVLHISDLFFSFFVALRGKQVVPGNSGFTRAIEGSSV